MDNVPWLDLPSGTSCASAEKIPGRNSPARLGVGRAAQTLSSPYGQPYVSEYFILAYLQLRVISDIFGCLSDLHSPATDPSAACARLQSSTPGSVDISRARRILLVIRVVRHGLTAAGLPSTGGQWWAHVGGRSSALRLRGDFAPCFGVRTCTCDPDRMRLAEGCLVPTRLPFGRDHVAGAAPRPAPASCSARKRRVPPHFTPLPGWDGYISFGFLFALNIFLPGPEARKVSVYGGDRVLGA